MESTSSQHKHTKGRIEKTQNYLEKWKIDLLVIERPEDLFYFTGKHLSAGIVFISSKGATLFADGRYFHQCATLQEFETILYEEKNIKSFFDNFPSGLKIGFDSDHLVFSRFLKWESICKEHGKHQLIPLTNPAFELRMVKDEEETKKMTEAARICSQGYDFLLSQVETGITEIELVKRLELFFLEKGGRFSFNPIIAFGERTANPHYTPGPFSLKEGEAVLFDLGFEWDHYQSDMTRTIFWKNVSPKLEEIYFVVKEAQERALKAVKPQVLAKDLDAFAREFIKEKGYGEFFNHNLGHGVGMEVHEYPSLSPKGKEEHVLEPNMVITIEPGIYLPGIGGVRIENSVVVTEKGFFDLTQRSTELQVLGR